METHEVRSILAILKQLQGRQYSKFIIQLWCDQAKISWNSQILFLRYSQTKPIVCFVSLFVQSFNCLYLWNQLPNLCGIFIKLKPKQYLIETAKKKQKSFFFLFRTHFAWLHHSCWTCYWVCTRRNFSQSYAKIFTKQDIKTFHCRWLGNCIKILSQ